MAETYVCPDPPFTGVFLARFSFLCCPVIFYVRELYTGTYMQNPHRWQGGIECILLHYMRFLIFFSWS